MKRAWGILEEKMKKDEKDEKRWNWSISSLYYIIISASIRKKKTENKIWGII